MSPPEDGRHRVALVVWLGLIAFLSLQLSLYVLAGLPLPDAVLLAALLVLMPALAVAQVPLMDVKEIERLPAYWSSMAALCILGTICWLVGTRARGPAAIGVTALAPAQLVAWTLGLTAAGLGVIVVFRRLALELHVRESPLLRALLPRTAGERGVFALLSVAAGVGEEVAYRGYAIPVLIPVVGPVAALVLTSAVFGVLHVYQGALGIFRTALMGAVLAGGFLLSGSLLPPVIAHTLIDLVAGILIAEKLLLPPPDTGVGGADLPLSED